MSKQETITIPRVDYDAMLATIEDLTDNAAYDAAVANPGEPFPSELVERLIGGDHPLTVFREYRGLSKVALAKASEVNRVQIADIERGTKTGSVATLRKLAQALDLTIDDLV